MTTTSDTLSYDELITALNQPGLEGFGDDLRRIVDKTFPRIAVSLKDTFRSMTTWNHARPEMVHPRAMKARLRKVDYLDLEDVMVPVPNGLSRPLPEYVNYLQESVLPTMLTLKMNILPGLKAGLGRFINEPELFQEKRLPDLVDMNTPLREHVTKGEAGFIHGGNRISDRPFGDVFEKVADVNTTFEQLNKLNQHRWKEANPKDMQVLVQQVSVLATEVLKSIETMEGNPRKEPMQEIATMITEAAHWISWFGLVSARIVETTTAAKLTETKLLRAL